MLTQKAFPERLTKSREDCTFFIKHFILKYFKRQVFLISLYLKMLNGPDTLVSKLCDQGQKN